MSWLSFRALSGKLLSVLVFVGVVGTLPAAAADRGTVTNLPLPRFVSMKASEGNVRRGPSLSHRIDWVYKRRNMPLQITAPSTATGGVFRTVMVQAVGCITHFCPACDR